MPWTAVYPSSLAHRGKVVVTDSIAPGGELRQDTQHGGVDDSTDSDIHFDSSHYKTTQQQDRLLVVQLLRQREYGPGPLRSARTGQASQKGRRSASADSGEAALGGDWRQAGGLIMNQEITLSRLAKGCVTPRNCSLVLPSDLIANASLSLFHAQAQSPSQLRRASLSSKGTHLPPHQTQSSSASWGLVYQRVVC